MVLDTISKSLDVLNKSADFIKKLQEIGMNTTLPDEVKKVNAKLDQEVTGKIKGGYESIRFALRKNADDSSRDEELEDARKSLRDCVHLSEKLDTDGIPNGDVMAMAHYGLAIIYNLKRNNDRAAYHLLKAFEARPRKTRELVPEIYNDLFKLECGAFESIYSKDEVWQQALLVERKYYPYRGNFSLGMYVPEVMKQQADRLKQQDDCCRKIATQYLEKFSFE